MSKDFLATRARTGKIIGANTVEAEPKLIVYSDSNATDRAGGIENDVTTRIGKCSKDTFIYFDGIPGSKKAFVSDDTNTANHYTVSVFGGDLVVSGTLYAEGNASSMWEIDGSDNLIPTNTIDGDTGLFAMNFDEVVEVISAVGASSSLVNIDYSRYTLSSRDYALDLFFEVDPSDNNNIMPK
jgi:hypothetical protein